MSTVLHPLQVAIIPVTATDKIAIYTTDYVYYSDSTDGSVFSNRQQIIQKELVITPSSGVKFVQLVAGDAIAYYEVGTDPVVALPISSSEYGSDGAVGTGTTNGGAGGGHVLAAGNGGAKTGTETANGGDGGPLSRTGGDGGATAATDGTAAGGAGGDINDTAGNGGAASAGTADGGAGGSIRRTPGSGGDSAGGTAGVDGMLIDRGLILTKQGDPSAKTVSSTLTPENIKDRIITVNQDAGAASDQQLPLASQMDTAFPDAIANDSFDFSMINTSVVVEEAASITTNTGWTLVGPMAIPAASSASFRARKTGLAAWVLYRI